MMKIVSKKMIKPCTPTPQNLTNYNISLTDQFMPPMNIPIVLFYSSSPSNNDLDFMSINHLQQSLANILPRFYPLAGRYVKRDHVVHCNDEGVEFVEAHACSDDFKSISEYVKSGTHEQLNDKLLPRHSLEIDEATYPMVSIQATRFVCGGIAIGLSVSHRIVDADSISTFIRAWAQEANNPSISHIVKPSFDIPTLLPFKSLFPGSEDIQLQKITDPNIICKRFLFNKDVIAALKAEVRDGSRHVSKVGVVCAIISKAMIHVDRLKHGRFRNFIIAQAVNLRDRTIPPFPKHSCGNIVGLATLKLSPSNSSDDDTKLNVRFEGLVSLLRDAVDKTIADCASIFNDQGHKILTDGYMVVSQTIMSGCEEAEMIAFSDWSKFEFYGADFGWGKPIWTSIGTVPINKLVVLIGNKEGDGIEAWVHLFKEDMVLFEQEEDIIRLFVDTKNN